MSQRRGAILFLGLRLAPMDKPRTCGEVGGYCNDPGYPPQAEYEATAY